MRERKGERPPEAEGFALIEVLVGLAILTIAFLGTMSGMFFSLRLNGTNRETASAVQMGRAVLEEVRSCPFERVYAEYNAVTEDDPEGPGTAHGEIFTVSPAATMVVYTSATETEAEPAGDRRRPPVATILFPTSKDGTLREDVSMPEFGLPMDLNGDGAVTSGDRSADYLVLPVLVRVAWRGADGDRVVEFFTILRE